MQRKHKVRIITLVVCVALVLIALNFSKLLLLGRIAVLNSQTPDTELLMPVEGVRVSDIADTWQALRSGGRKHEGQDIFAPKGTAIYSATNGYVARIGFNELGGNYVYVVGAGGRFYYYAHLDTFAEDLSVGDAVTPDTVLGTVGNTGGAQTTPAHLHFGMYHFSTAHNPLPLLKNR